jgi:hypothetical protein
VIRRTALTALLAAALFALPAHASVEEFSTFDVLRMDADDESFLDRYLARPPAEWRTEWEGATGGVRADQGCLTSETWYQSNEFKARAPLGRRSWLDVGFLQRTDLEASWEWFQFDFHRATDHYGVLGWRVRPTYEKSQQDFAVMWDGGDATTPLQGRATFTFEDAFNKFWEFRTARVGNHAEPYAAHPFEPALAGAWRGPRHLVEVSGTWLTPSHKDILDPDPALAGTYALWGAKLAARAERTLGAQQVVAAFEDIQARSEQTLGSRPGNGRVFRRRWTAEMAVRRDLAPRLRLEARYLYQDRDQSWLPPAGQAEFRALDRTGALELGWRAHPDWLLKTGLLYDRIGVAQAGWPPGFVYRSRKETRAYFGFQARFDKVQFQVVEGIELDAEPYSVTFHHDKTFLHLQTTF